MDTIARKEELGGDGEAKVAREEGGGGGGGGGEAERSGIKDLRDLGRWNDF